MKAKSSIEEPEISPHIQALYDKYGDRIQQWVRAGNPVRALPVYRDSEGEWQWLSRSERRRLLKK